jgi:putative Mg2+ transporter-C (MgtC) family protein
MATHFSENDMISNQEVFLRILTAAVLGAVIGVNRGRLEWAAGLRTHMLVSVGAALAVIVSAYGFNHALLQDHVVLDPSRIAAQVVSGIGFLGAGTIMFMAKEQVVRGLTTAAGLWAVAAVGLASGAGLYVPAVVTTAMLWVILALLKPVERRFVRRRRRHALLVVSISHGSALAAVERVMSDYRAPIDRLQLKRDAQGGDVVTARFPADFASEKLSEIADACRGIEGSRDVTIALPG